MMISWRKTVLALLAILSALVTQPAFSENSSPLDLANPQPEENLALYMSGFQSAHDDIHELHDALTSTRWSPVANSPEILQSPRSYSTLWLKARLTNSSSAPIQRWLELSPWRLSEADAWLLEGTAAVSREINTGMNIPVDERSVKNVRALIPVTLNPGEVVELIIHVHSDSMPYLKITNWDPIQFTEDETSRHQIHSLLLAVILTLVAVLLLQLNLRYFLVSLWMLALFIFESEKEGYITYLLFQGATDYASHLRFASSIVAKSFFLVVSVFVLNLNKHKIWQWLLPVTAAFSLLYTGLTFFLDNNTLREIAAVFHLLAAIIWLSMVPSALKDKRKWQKTIVSVLGVGWLTSTTFVLVYVLNINYTGEFGNTRIIVEALVVLALLLVYSQQKRDYEQSLERQLHTREQEERRKLEIAVEERTRELNTAVESARQANASKTEFLSRVTHDLKSPLTSILGYAQLLQASGGDIGQKSRIIFNSASHMLNMVTRLIDYARDVTTVEFQPRMIYLSSFIENLNHEAKLVVNKYGNKFNLDIKGELYPLIKSDETFLREILLNLIDNAAKYTEEGTVTLHICTEALLPESNRLHLIFEVEDTGCGIERDKLERLFDPFFRVSDRTEGAGLGLSIVKELVSKMSGIIDLQSEPGKGTRISVTLPVEKGQEAEDSAFVDIPWHMLPELDAGGKTAWVVEDAPAISKLLKSELEGLNFHVVIFESAESAKQNINNKALRPDLIITDYRLPGASGNSVLEAARQSNPHTPVILLSATWDLEQKTDIPAEHRYSAHLNKPVDLSLLRREIARICKIPLLRSETTDELLNNVSTASSADSISQLEQWIELGAVSDIVDWCNRFKTNHPQHQDLANRIASMAVRGDFYSITSYFDELATAAENKN